MATRAPFSAMAWAMALPRPRLPPVTKATLFFRSISKTPIEISFLKQSVIAKCGPCPNFFYQGRLYVTIVKKACFPQAKVLPFGVKINQNSRVF
jgi:hypothetical protein